MGGGPGLPCDCTLYIGGPDGGPGLFKFICPDDGGPVPIPKNVQSQGRPGPPPMGTGDQQTGPMSGPQNFGMPPTSGQPSGQQKFGMPPTSGLGCPLVGGMP
jgi:hypothetical protein